MSRQLESDRILLGAVVVLVFFGTLMVFSASAVMASERFGSSYYFLLRQAAWAGLGLAAMVSFMNLDYRRLSKPSLVFTLLAVQIVLLISVLLSDPSHHARRWLHLGGLSFQPSEISKLVLVLFLAYFLETRQGTVNDWQHTLSPIALVGGTTGALVTVGTEFRTSPASRVRLA